MNLDTDNIKAVSLCQRWMNIKTKTKNTKHLSVSRDTFYYLKPHKQCPAEIISWQSTSNKKSLFDHVVLEQTCGTNSRSLSVINLSLALSPNPRLLSKHWKCWWTVPMYVEPFLLFITKRSKFKELELTQKILEAEHWMCESH